MVPLFLAATICACVRDWAWPVLVAADQAAGGGAAAEKAEPLLKRLDPISRTKVLMALTALLLLGGLLVAVIMLWGRHARRKIREPLPASRLHDDEWYNKPLVPKPSDEEGDESD